MKISLDGIQMAQRIRQDVNKIDELAADMQKNSLINPITVMPLGDGCYQLITGLRRLRAAEHLGWADIEATVVAPADAVDALNMEFSENEQRKDFTPEERVRYGLLMETAIKAAAKERKTAGKRNKDDRGQSDAVGDSNHVVTVPHGKTREIVGAKIGMSGRSYERAKYVFENADERLIEQVNTKQKSINAAFNEVRAKKAVAGDTPSVPAKGNIILMPSPPAYAEHDRLPEALPAPPKVKPRTPTKEERNTVRIAMLEERVKELEAALHEARCETNLVRAKLDGLEDQYHNQIYHRQSTLDAQKVWIEKLEAALVEAGVPFPERRMNVV